MSDSLDIKLNVQYQQAADAGKALDELADRAKAVDGAKISIAPDMSKLREAVKELDILSDAVAGMENHSADINLNSDSLHNALSDVDILREKLAALSGVNIGADTTGLKAMVKELDVINERIIHVFDQAAGAANQQWNADKSDPRSHGYGTRWNGSNGDDPAEDESARKERIAKKRKEWRGELDSEAEAAAAKVAAKTAKTGDKGGSGEGGDKGDSSLSKMLKYAFGMWGGMSVLGMAQQAWGSYKQQEEAESGLKVRGFNFKRDLSPWAYTPQEEAAYAANLMRTTGAKDMGTLRGVEKFSRLTNIDPGQATSMLGSYYQNTGADPAKQKQAIDAMIYMGKQAKDGRSEALLQQIAQNLNVARAAQGGKELTNTQVAQAMAVTAGLYNGMGTMGKDGSLFNTMQTALMPGGGQVGDVMKWGIYGGFEPGAMTAEGAVEMAKRRDKGLLYEPNRINLKKTLKGHTPAQQTIDIAMLLNNFSEQGSMAKDEAIRDFVMSDKGIGDKKEVLKLISHLKAAGSPQAELTRIGVALGGDVSLWSSSEFGKKGGIGEREAQKGLATINGGNVLEPFLGSIESTVLGGGNEILSAAAGVTNIFSKSISRESLEPEVNRLAKKYNLDPKLIWATLETENAPLNPWANSGKAKGLMQLTPDTAKRYNVGADRIFDPMANLEAGVQHLSVLSGKFKGDPEKVAWAYNAGEGAARSGRKPTETQQYIPKFMKHFREETIRAPIDAKDPGFLDPGDNAMRKAEYIAVFAEKALIILGAIAENTRRNGAQPSSYK